MSTTLPLSAVPDTQVLDSQRRSSTDAVGRWLALALVPAYGFFVPLVIVPVSGERVGLSDPLLLLTLPALLLARPFARPRLHHVAMLMFLVAALFSLLQIDDADIFRGSLFRWLRLVALTAPLYLSLVLPADNVQIRRAMKAFCWGGGAAILAGLLVYWLQIPIYANSQKLWLTNAPPKLRASGLIGDTGAFGHLIALWGLLAVGMLVIETKSVSLMKLGAVAVVVTYSVLVSSSRAALLNVVGGFFVLWLLSSITRRAHRNAVAVGAGAFALLLAAGLCWYSFAGDSNRRIVALQGSLERFTGSGGEMTLNGFASGRLENWTAFLSEFSQELVLGMGYKASPQLLRDRCPDNALLGVAIETGIPGLLCILVVLLSIFYGLYVRHRGGNRYATLLLAVWVGQVLHGFTADTFTMWMTMPLLYLLTGLVLQLDVASGNPSPDSDFDANMLMEPAR